MTRQYVFQITVQVPGPDSAKAPNVTIACDHVPFPFAAVVAATEHMMTMTAIESDQKFG